METGGRLERCDRGAGHEVTELQKGCAGDSPGGRAGHGSGDGCSHPAAQGREAAAPPLHFSWSGGTGCPCRSTAPNLGARLGLRGSLCRAEPPLERQNPRWVTCLAREAGQCGSEAGERQKCTPPRGPCQGQKGDPMGKRKERGQECSGRTQRTVHSSALDDRDGRKSAETRRNKKSHALTKPPAATGLVPQAQEEEKPQTRNEEGA